MQINSMMRLGLMQAGGAAGSAPKAPAVRTVVSPVGDSWTEGNEQRVSRDNTDRPADIWDYQMAALLGVPKYDTPGQTGVTAGVINVGYGGQKTNTIKTNLLAILSGDPTRLEDAFILGPGRNDTPDASGDAAILSGVDAMTAAIPHSRVVVWPPDGALGGVTLSSYVGSWVRAKKVLWAYREDARRKYLFELGQFYRGLSPNGSSGSSTDDADAAGDKLIGSLAASAGVDQQHPNYVAAPLWASAFKPLVDAMWNQAVYVLDTTLAVPFDMAEGAYKEIYFKGHVTGCSILADDVNHPGLFTLAMKPGSNDTAILIRTSVSPGDIPRILNLQVTATGVDTDGAARTDTGHVRIAPTLAGATSTAPRGVTLQRDTHATASSRRWPYFTFEAPLWANGAKFSFAARLKVGEDGSYMVVFCLSSTRLVVQRWNTNAFNIQIKDSAGATIANWFTTGATFNAAAGAFWFFFDVDMNGGAPIINLWANIGGADVNVSPGTTPAAGNGVIGLANHPYLFNTGSGQCNFKGSVGTMWAADDVLAGGGFSLAANRRLFCSLAGAPVDLGAAGVVGGITPELYLPGGPGDWLTGRNFGSGAQGAFNDNWLKGFGANSSDPLPF